MPQELPGFYYDAEKNRYFPIKGPIPGSSRSRSAPQKPTSKPPHQPSQSHGTRAGTSKLLQLREFSGNILSLTKGKHNFKEEFQKRLASRPTVWKYQDVKISDGALEQIRVDVITPEGEYKTDLLLAGSVIGSTISFFEVGKVGQEVHNGIKYIPDQVWPLTKETKEDSYKAPDLIWNPNTVMRLLSSVSCIKLSAKHSTFTTHDGFHLRRALITTMGSETSGGSVYVLNLVDPVNSNISTSITSSSIHKVSSFNCTIWTADYNSSADQAVIGTDLGAAVINLESGRHSWVLRSRSDVLAQQLLLSNFESNFELQVKQMDMNKNSPIDFSLRDENDKCDYELVIPPYKGNVVLNGLRNGAIVTVDIRERPEGTSNRLITHQIPCSPLHSSGHSSKNQWFKLRGNMCPSSTVFMPSSISSLVSLHFNDQYFLASSMDGSVKLYDHRLIKRGPVQSYEGHVNSHTRMQLGVDQSERFVMSGGEDCNLRIWSIRSGEMLFEEKFSNSIPINVCWRRPETFVETLGGRQSDEDFQFGQSCSSDAWIRTQEGIFHMHWY